MLDAERGARVALRVEIDDKRPEALQRKRRGDIHRGRRLAHAALLIGDGEHALARRPRKLPTLCVVQQAHGAFGFSANRGVGDRRVLPRFIGGRLPCFT
jgi:hypothetical protein